MDRKTAALISAAAVSGGTLLCASASVKMFKTRKRKGPEPQCEGPSVKSRRCRRRPVSQTVKMAAGGFFIGAGVYGLTKIIRDEDLTEIVIQLPDKEEIRSRAEQTLNEIAGRLAELPDKLEAFLAENDRLPLRGLELSRLDIRKGLNG